MLRFENYFCCLFNCYFIFCSYVLLSENKLSFTYHFHILNDHQNNLSHFFSGVKCNAAPPFAFSFKTSLSPAFIFL